MAETSMAIPEPPECQNGFIYTVKQGDTLFLIARRFGIRLEDLIAANPQISDPNQIMPGQRICVPVPQTPECPNGTIYTVEKGDSLYTIAQRQGTTVQAILAVNPQITDPNLIYPGQKICIPAATTPEPAPPMPHPPPPPCPEGFIYTVQSGDSLYSIAQRYGTTLGAIVAANPQITDPNVIHPGQRICVPIAPAPPCPTGFIYTVQGGDSLYTIAARFGTTVPAIMAVNPQITNPNVIYPGQKICIPIAPAPDCPAGVLYAVMQGDTIYGIATKYGTTVPAIMAANPQITDPNLIYPGQKICIPHPHHYQHHTHHNYHKHPDHHKPPHAVYCPNGFVYIARQSDTLYTIGRRFGVGLEAMIEANPSITDPDRIYPGQRICVPRQPWWPWPGPWGPCGESGAEMPHGAGAPAALPAMAPPGQADHHYQWHCRPMMCVEHCRRMYSTVYGGEAGHVAGCCYNDPHPEHNRMMVWAAGLPAPGKYPGGHHKYYYAWGEARNGDRVHWRLSEYEHCWMGCYYPKHNRCWVRMYVTVEKDKDPKRPSDKIVLDSMPQGRSHTT